MHPTRDTPGEPGAQIHYNKEARITANETATTEANR